MLSVVEVHSCQLFIRASVTAFTVSLNVMEKLQLFCRRYRSRLTLKSSDCVIKALLALTTLTSSHSSNASPQPLCAACCDSSMLSPDAVLSHTRFDLASFTLSNDVLYQSISQSLYQGPSLQSVS